MAGKRRKRLLCLIAAVVLAAVSVFGVLCYADEGGIEEKPGFSIRFLDVGQADAALIECEGHYMMIDGGDRKDSQLIYTVLKESNITKLDLIIGTHGDADHVGGLAGALNYASADTILCSVTENDTKAFNNFKKYADKNGGIKVPEVGDEYTLGSAKVEIIGMLSENSSGTASGDDSNEDSIITKITYGDTSFLFMGDAEESAENAVMHSEYRQLLASDVLKVGHHGSKSSTSEAFLDQVAPDYAVISVGKGNSYGHPTEKVLNRLKNSGAALYRTDLQGEIVCTSDGTNIKFTAEKNTQEDVFEAPASEEKQAPKQEAAVPAPTQAAESAQQAPAAKDYVVNTNTDKFHDPGCKSVKQMSEKNKMYYTGSRDDLIAQGYDPCKNCNP